MPQNIVSLTVTGAPGRFMLTERDHAFQGNNPHYTDLCPLTDEEASALVASRLVDAMADVPRMPGVAPASYLALEHQQADLAIVLRLPATEPRTEALHRTLPGYDGMLAVASADAAKRDNLLRNTRIRDASAS